MLAVLLKAIEALFGICVREAEELEGLDLGEHGLDAYEIDDEELMAGIERTPLPV